jgi:hypothetical protein
LALIALTLFFFRKLMNKLLNIHTRIQFRLPTFKLGMYIFIYALSFGLCLGSSWKAILRLLVVWVVNTIQMPKF